MLKAREENSEKLGESYKETEGRKKKRKKERKKWTCIFRIVSTDSEETSRTSRLPRVNFPRKRVSPSPPPLRKLVQTDNKHLSIYLLETVSRLDVIQSPWKGRIIGRWHRHRSPYPIDSRARLFDRAFQDIFPPPLPSASYSAPPPFTTPLARHRCSLRATLSLFTPHQTG